MSAAVNFDYVDSSRRRRRRGSNNGSDNVSGNGGRQELRRTIRELNRQIRELQEMAEGQEEIDEECLSDLKDCNDKLDESKADLKECNDNLDESKADIADLKKEIKRLKNLKNKSSGNNHMKIYDCFPNECDFVKSCRKRKNISRIVYKDPEEQPDIPNVDNLKDIYSRWIDQYEEILKCLKENVDKSELILSDCWFGTPTIDEDLFDSIGVEYDLDGNRSDSGGIFALSGQRTNNILRCFGGENLPEPEKLPTKLICTPKDGWRIVYNNKRYKCDPHDFYDDDDDCCIEQPEKQIPNYGKCEKERICKKPKKCKKSKKQKHKFSIKDYCHDDGELKLPKIEVCNISNDFKFVCPKQNINIDKLCDYIDWSKIKARDSVDCKNVTPCYIYTNSDLKYKATNWLIDVGGNIKNTSNIQEETIISYSLKQIDGVGNVSASDRYDGLCCNKICYNPDLFVDCDEIIEHQKEFKVLSNKFECLICIVRDFLEFSNGKVLQGSIPGGDGWIRDKVSTRDKCNLPDEVTLWKAVGSILPKEKEECLLNTRALKLAMNARSKCELINSEFGKAKYWPDYLNIIQKAQLCAQAIVDNNYYKCLINEKSIEINEIKNCVDQLIGELVESIIDENNKLSVELWFEIQTNLNKIFCIVQYLLDTIELKQQVYDETVIFSQVDSVFNIWGGLIAQTYEATPTLGELSSLDNPKINPNIRSNLALNTVIEDYDVAETESEETFSNIQITGKEITKIYAKNLKCINPENLDQPTFFPHDCDKDGNWKPSKFYDNDLFNVVPIVTPCPDYDCKIDINENGILINPNIIDLRKPRAFDVYQQFLNEGNQVSDPENITRTTQEIETDPEADPVTFDGDGGNKSSDFRWRKIKYCDTPDHGITPYNNNNQDISNQNNLVFPRINMNSILINDNGTPSNGVPPLTIFDVTDILKNQKGIICTTYNKEVFTKLLAAPASPPPPLCPLPTDIWYKFNKKIVGTPGNFAESSIGTLSNGQNSTVTFSSLDDENSDFVYRNQNNINDFDGVEPNPALPATPEGVGYYIFPGYSDKEVDNTIDGNFINFPGYIYPGLLTREELLCVPTLEDEIKDKFNYMVSNGGTHILESERIIDAFPDNYVRQYGPSGEQFKEHYCHLNLCDPSDLSDTLGWSETFASLGFATTTFQIKHCPSKFDCNSGNFTVVGDGKYGIKSYVPIGYDIDGNIVQAWSQPGHVKDGPTKMTYTAWPPIKGDRIPASLVKYLLKPIPKCPQCSIATKMTTTDPYFCTAKSIVGLGNYPMTHYKGAYRFDRSIESISPSIQSAVGFISGTAVNNQNELGGDATFGYNLNQKAISSSIFTGGDVMATAQKRQQSQYVAVKSCAEKQFEIIQRALQALQDIIENGGEPPPPLPEPSNPEECRELSIDFQNTTNDALQELDDYFIQLFKSFPKNREVFCKKARKKLVCELMICDKKNGCHPKKHKKKSCKCRDYSTHEFDSWDVSTSYEYDSE